MQAFLAGSDDEGMCQCDVRRVLLSRPCCALRRARGVQAFLTGSDDKSMCQCDVRGGVTRRWKLARINDLALSADGAVLATVCQEKQIKLSRLQDPREQVCSYTD